MCQPGLHSSRRSRFHADFLWRTTGFPCELLEQFGLDVLATDIRRLVSDKTQRTSWRNIYAGLLSDSLTSSFNTAFGELRSKLYDVAQSNKFQIAVACSSPAAATLLRRKASIGMLPRRSQEKRVELLAMRYLQRFVTKCETSAFFGSVATGCLGDVPDQVTFQYDSASYRGIGFVGDRFLGAVLERLRCDPEILWRVRVRRRSAVAFGLNQTIIHPRFGRLQLDKRVCDLLASASVPTPVVKLLAGWPDAQTAGLRAVLGLIEIGALSDELEQAWYSSDPIKLLRPYLGGSAAASDLMALFDVLDNALVMWPKSDSIDRQSWLDSVVNAGGSSGIQHGPLHAGFYADHLPLFEEGFSSRIRLCLDESWAAPFLRDLELVVRASLARDATRSHEMLREIARRLSARHRGPLTLPDFLTEIADIGQVEVEQAMESSSDFSAPVITSPDVQIAAADLSSLRRRECLWVLSECHSSVAIAGFFVRPMPEPDQWLSNIDAFLAEQLPRAQPVVVASARYNKTSFLGPLRSARYLEAGLSAPPGTHTVALEDLEVVLGEDLRLVVRGTKVPVILIPGHLEQAAPWLECFRTPRFHPLPATSKTGGREMLGAVVYRRSRWELEGSNLPDRRADVLEVFTWAQSQRQLHQMPRWIFARPTADRKPLCIDLSNPFLCEELLRLLRSESRLCVEEMYPEPNAAWVQGSEGRYLGELRFLYAAGGNT